MRGKVIRVISVLSLLLILNPEGALVLAQTSITVNQAPYVSELYFSPKTETVTTDSQFDASLFIDTKGFSINTVDIKISFPANLISVVSPSAGDSIIGAWVAPPKYSNSQGTIEFSGIVPGGIETDSGLVEKITFKAIAPGSANITIQKSTHVLLNDGLGTETDVESIPLKLTISAKTPDGPVVTSDTHPLEGEWSNNKNPVFSWASSGPNERYSYVLDDKPFTIPDDVATSTDTQVGYENIKDGIWYFHLKTKNGNLWSNTTHYTIRIDTTPPAIFTPTVDFLSNSNKAPGIVSFFTTDALSGVSHYEVGVLDTASSQGSLPAFIQSESPYFLPRQILSNVLLTVRAIDNAGNVRDVTMNVNIPPMFMLFIRNYSVQLFLGLSLLFLFVGIMLFIHSRKKRHLLENIHPDDLKRILDFAAQRYIIPQINSPDETRSFQKKTDSRRYKTDDTRSPTEAEYRIPNNL